MADWTYVPLYPFRIEPKAPPTLITEYEDGTEHRRQKNSNERTMYRHVYTEDSTTVDAMLNFLRSKGLLTSFSIVSYDPDDAPATEVQVRLRKMPRPVRQADDMWQLTIEFVKVYGEP